MKSNTQDERLEIYLFMCVYITETDGQVKWRQKTQGLVYDLFNKWRATLIGFLNLVRSSLIIIAE